MARLVLWPGLAADARMYGEFGETGWALELPALPEPAVGEDLGALARREAQRLAIAPGDWVGGCSFGAMLAAEIARQRPVAGLVLLAGALDSATLSPLARLFGGSVLSLPAPLLYRLLALDVSQRLFFGAAPREWYDLARAMLAATSVARLRRGAHLALTCRGGAPACPVFALHGGRDRVMGPPPVAGVELLAAAGHGLVVTHAAQATEFLRRLAVCAGSSNLGASPADSSPGEP